MEIVNRPSAGKGRQLVKDELAARQADLSAVLEAAGVGVFDIDIAAGRFVNSNGMNEVFGYSADHTMTLDDVRARYHPEDGREVVEQSIFRVNDPAVTQFREEYRLLMPDGSVRWLQGRGQYLRDRAGKAVRTRGLVIDITYRKNIEQERTAAQDRLALALEAGRIGVWEWDILRNKFEYDARGRTILGFSPDEPITYEKLRATTHPDDLAKTTPLLQAALDPAVRSHAPYEYRINRRDGSVRWIYAFGQVTFAKVSGVDTPVHYTGTIEDVTARKEAEASARASEARLKLAMEAAHLGLWEYDGATEKLTASPELNRLYGFPSDAVVALDQFATRYEPGEAERIAAVGAESVKRGERFFQIEFRVRLPNGELRWLLLRAETDVSAEGQVLHSLGVVMDITERKAAEARLTQALADTEIAAREASRRFQLLVNGAQDHAIYMLDPLGNVTSWNKGAERIKGYRADDVIGENYSIFFTEEDRREGLPEIGIEKARMNGRFESEGWRVRKDGSRFWASASLEPVFDEGALIGFAKITRDVTEKREAQMQLDKTREQLFQSQKMEAVGQLTGGVAHDFNNLLTVIQGNLETAQRRLGQDALDRNALRRAVENSLEGAHRAATLTQQLLAFSRRQPLEPKRLDPNRVINEVRDFVQSAVGESIQVLAVGVGGVWPINADRNQLDTALINLGMNARDAMPNGGSLTLETSNVYLDQEYCRANPDVIVGDYVLISVTDTGTGMQETLAKAIEPFFTTKPPGRGTGLGLSQVYGFTKQSGGHFKLYSEIGQGTTARIYLPRAIGNAKPAEAASEAPRADVPRAVSSEEVILVVEDNDDVRGYLRGVLGELGYTVIEKADAASGLSVIQDRGIKIDLLLTDVVLPDFNGRLLAERTHQIRPDLSVVYMTGYSRNAIVHQGRLDAGVTLIQKPISQEVLARRVREALDAAKQTKPS